jgi:hypothetical protein
MSIMFSSSHKTALGQIGGQVAAFTGIHIRVGNNLRFPDPLLKPSGPFSGNLRQFVGHSVVGLRSKSLK